eukprot:TRINITY_DN5724_c0_g1_i1.p1 TRINITY_DN5724_c0_g1~~TRINITY_DN5724_c0_g1_i1.p1  ORF type:complete len:852 (+),score=83.36 TRINITY_DN5724_c0_g1_i1:153-2708(+)
MSLHRNLLLGISICLACVWGSYFAFVSYERHTQELGVRDTQVAHLRKQADKLEEELHRRELERDFLLLQVNSTKTDHEQKLLLQKQIDTLKQQLKQDQEQFQVQLGNVRKQQQDDEHKRGTLPIQQQQPPAPSCAGSSALSGLRRPKTSLDMEALKKNTDQYTTLHVISHTHWDREWYLPFETFRGRLVSLLDTVMDRIEEDPNFKHFHLDGQMVPVDDYVQVREHSRELFHAANIAGKIALGPWYVQPDEFLASAEALVRNLQYGILKAEELGGASYIGYIPDSFGHIAQMPQLLQGFGITSAVSGRGIEAHYGSEAWWEGPDGSRVIFIFLSKWYCNGLDMPTDHVPSHYWERKKHELKPQAATSHLLLMNGCDHTAPDPQVGSKIASGQFPGNTRVVHSNMDDYIALVEDEIKTKSINLRVRQGELRYQVEGLTNTLSNKITQKQANWRMQILLEKWAEPLEAIGWALTSRKYDRDTIWYAWRLLLENHPHDSICGCSSQEVHRDVDNRFARLKEVATHLTTMSSMHVANALAQYRRASGTRILVMNPTNIPRKEVILVSMYGQGGSAVSARASTGEVVLCQMIQNYGSHWSYTLPSVGFRAPRTEGHFVFAMEVTVPSLGFEVYAISNSGQPPPGNPQNFVARDASFHGIEERAPARTAGDRKPKPAGGRRKLLEAADEFHMENENLRVTIGKNGDATVVHKTTLKSYAGVNVLEDVGDGGDQYAFRRTGNANTLGIAGSTIDIKPVKHFPTHSIVEVCRSWPLPCAANNTPCLLSLSLSLCREELAQSSISKVMIFFLGTCIATYVPSSLREMPSCVSRCSAILTLCTCLTFSNTEKCIWASTSKS